MAGRLRSRSRTDSGGKPAPLIAYLIPAYPAVTHVFISREIDALRERGVNISTFSIRRAPADQLLSAADRTANRETFALLPVSLWRLVSAHLVALVTRPTEYAATLCEALAMAGPGARARLWQLFYFAEAIVMWRECKRRRVRHIHAHFANVACAVALIAARFGERDGLSWSFTMHGPIEFENVELFALAEKVRSAAFVACISDYCRSQLMRITEPELWGKLALVRCGLPSSPAGGQAIPRTSPSIVQETSAPVLRVLCVGRLVPEKGQIVLLRAMSKLRANSVPVTLTIVGDGPSLAQLRAEADALGVGDAVRFTGALGREEVSALYREVDAFCLPSFAEGVPVVLMEAMAAGLPVVATRIAGIPELIEDGVSGLIVAPGRPEPITDRLTDLARDGALRRHLGAAGRARVAEAYRVEESAARLHALFSEAIQPA